MSQHPHRGPLCFPEVPQHGQSARPHEATNCAHLHAVCSSAQSTLSQQSRIFAVSHAGAQMRVWKGINSLGPIGSTEEVEVG
eukprot:6465454-Amphidinium_carterae.1